MSTPDDTLAAARKWLVAWNFFGGGDRHRTTPPIEIADSLAALLSEREAKARRDAFEQAIGCAKAEENAALEAMDRDEQNNTTHFACSGAARRIERGLRSLAAGGTTE